MPVSKKRKGKKKSVIKPRFTQFSLTHKMLEQLRELFGRMPLIVHIKLPKGTCTHDDISLVRDMINLLNAGLATRTWLDQDEREEVRGYINAAVQAMSSIIPRGRKAGHYTCTGDELNALWAVEECVDAYIQDSLNTCPRRLLKEWRAVVELTRLRQGEETRTELIEDHVMQRMVNTIGATPWWEKNHE